MSGELASPAASTAGVSELELEALVGHRFAGGRYRIEHWENWLLTDCTGREPLPDGLAHPIVLFHVPILGVGTSIAELFQLGGVAGAGSVGLEGYDWEYIRPLQEDVEYRLEGGIVTARRTSDDTGRVDRPVRLRDHAVRRRRSDRRPGDQPLGATPMSEPRRGRSGRRDPPVDDAVWSIAARMRTMAAILRDPYPVHWDRDGNAAIGLPGRVINQGPLNLGYVVNMLLAWAGPSCVRRLSVSFGRPVLDGDNVTALGSVTACRRSTANVERPARCGSTATANTSSPEPPSSRSRPARPALSHVSQATRFPTRRANEGEHDGVRGRPCGDATSRELGERLGLARRPVGRERDRDLELGARAVPRRDHRTLRARVHAGHDGGRRRRGQRHRTLLVDLGQRRPARRSAVAGTADHVRSARAPRPPPPAAPAFSPKNVAPLEDDLRAVLPQARSPNSMAPTPPTPRRSSRSTSRSTASASSPDCPRKTPTCSATGSTATSSWHRATTRPPPAVGTEMTGYVDAVAQRPPRRPPRRHADHSPTPRSTASRSTGTSSSATSAC